MPPRRRVRVWLRDSRNRHFASDDYLFVTECSATACVATVVNGPKPANPTLPLPPRYSWDGSRWVHVYDWQWDCYMGEGVPKVYTPAHSVAYYTPQADGKSLRGVWRTDIDGGPCDGDVVMDVAGVPRRVDPLVRRPIVSRRVSA